MLFELIFFVEIREAIKYLTEALQTLSEVELEDVIEKVIDAVEKQPCKYLIFLNLAKFILQL